MYFMFVIFVFDMIQFIWLPEVDVTNVTVALYYGGLAKVTSVHILGTALWIHS